MRTEMTGHFTFEQWAPVGKRDKQSEFPKESIDTSENSQNHTSLYGIISIPKYAGVFINEIN